jgi:signal transduction histidine kinase
VRSLGELVELARGLHPRVLAESGLAGALGQLAASCPVDVELTAADVRLSAAVEVAAYFVCAEALANVAKYAAASRVWIDVRCVGADLTVRVRDDGVGGADARRGTGLRGLVDRVEAHGGSLRIESPPRRGTLLVATIPSKPAEAR